VADTLPDPVFLKDCEGRWLYANPATLEVVGRTAVEVLGRTDREIYSDPGIGAALMETDRRIMASGRPEVVEENIQTPGGLRVFLSTKSPLRDAEGRVIGLVGNARDITERKQAEAALREKEENLRTVFRTSPDATNVNRVEDGLYVAVNDGFTRITGWTEAEVLGRSSLELNIWDDPADRARMVAQLRRDGYVQNFEARFRRKDGSVLPGLMSARLITFSGEPMILTITRDITEWRRAEKERSRLGAQLLQAQKLESIGRLAGGVAHDFNNILTVILSCSEALGDDLARGLPPSAEEVSEIRSAAERGRELTAQLLAFARKQPSAPVVLDLGVVARESEGLLRRILGEDVRLVVDAPPRLWPVRADRGQVQQVLLNLAVNARDAMPKGGTLAIELRNVEAAAGSRAGGAASDQVRLAVRDTGTGIAPEAMIHLFEPFFTTKPQGKGTGLGLATVYGIVTQSGGRIHAESVPGQGSTFRIHFPRAPGVPDPAPAEAETTAAGGTETVLVVEDDPAVRRVTTDALRGAGYQVLAAMNGYEALDLARADAPRLDLCVTDVVMPGLNGKEVADELRRLRPTLPVLFVSGYPQDVVGARGLLEGSELLLKPFTPAALLRRVRALLDERSGR